MLPRVFFYFSKLWNHFVTFLTLSIMISALLRRRRWAERLQKKKTKHSHAHLRHSADAVYPARQPAAAAAKASVGLPVTVIKNGTMCGR